MPSDEALLSGNTLPVYDSGPLSEAPYCPTDTNMKNKQLKIGAVISYVSIIVNLLAGLFFTPWMIRKIGQNEYGLYTLANSLITLFLIDFGLSSATSRYISRYHAEGDEQAVDNFTGVVYKFYGIIDFVILAVLTTLYFFLPQIYVGLTSQELQQFKVVYIIAASFNVINPAVFDA